MAFIRVKRAKRRQGFICEYAYIVENQRKKRGNPVKQKTKKYLGRVYRFGKSSELNFLDYYSISDLNSYIASKEVKDIIYDLAKLELIKHGFAKHGKNIVRENCMFVKERIINLKEKSIALAFNEGYMTDYALRKLINFKVYDEEDGFEFAKMFVESGIDVPKEVFICIFTKKLGIQ